MFHGIYTAIITPFRDGKVDEKKLEELVTYQVEAGVQGVVPCGTTGESLYLTPAEQKRITEMCVHICKGKAHLMVGTGSLSAEETISLTKTAQKAGADSALVVPPWYVKPSQESLYQHYRKISESVDIPLVLYNNPSRTGVEISLETVCRLATLEQVQAIKDASPCLTRACELKEEFGGQLSLLAGNDDTLAAYLGMGGDGGIMVASNVAPTLCVDLAQAWKKNDLTAFKALWERAYPLLAALSLESNPAPIKYAMHLVRGVSLASRLPFVPLKDSTQKAIEKALHALGLWEPLVSVRGT